MVEIWYHECQKCGFKGDSTEFSFIDSEGDEFDVDFYCPRCGSSNTKKRVRIVECVISISKELKEYLDKVAFGNAGEAWGTTKDDPVPCRLPLDDYDYTIKSIINDLECWKAALHKDPDVKVPFDLKVKQKIGLPDVMALESVLLVDCPTGKVGKCNAYKFAPCPDCPLVRVKQS